MDYNKIMSGHNKNSKLFLCTVMSRPRRFFINWKKWEGGDMEGRIQYCISQVHAQRRVLQVERTFMAPEYESRKDAMTPFSSSSAIIGPNFESRSLILLTWDWTTCDLWEQGEKVRSLSFNYKIREQFLLTLKFI